MLNLKFSKIILHNFGSYEHAEIDLKDRGFCLVSGKNNCLADNATSNGSGKSLIFDAIIYALTGTTGRGVSKGLKNNKHLDEEMFVELSFLVDSTEYLIKRGED